MTIWLLIAAIVMDVATTLCVLHLGGRELNPLQRWLFARIAPAPAMLLTHGAIVWAFVALRSSLHPTTVMLLAAAWWAVVVWNLLQIWRQRRTKGPR